jgi:membrane fusion protein, multidrug efflux system
MTQPPPIPSAASADQPVSGRASRRMALRASGLALLVLLTGAGVRAYVNHAQAESVAQTTKEAAARTVLFTRPRAGQGARSLALPATLRGQNEASVYARTNGYVRAWKKDMGDAVKKGDVLVLIDTPEIDQELAQAQAVKQQIQARLELARTSLGRWEGLRHSDAVSQQELDERRADVQQLQADLNASAANVKRLQQLHDFGRVTAPFDGVVLRRNVELGALVASGSGSGARPLYELTQSKELRLTVGVPQAFTGDVTVGKEVGIKLIERPNAVIKGRVERMAGGLDAATRSVQVEISLPNADGKLLPGTYVEVNLPLAKNSKTLVIPPNALQFRQDGPRVAVVDANGRVSLRNIKIGRDLGRSVEVISGLGPADAVVLNPHDTVIEGEQVVAREAPKPKDDAAAAKEPAQRSSNASTKTKG